MVLTIYSLKIISREHQDYQDPKDLMDDQENVDQKDRQDHVVSMEHVEVQ